MDFWREAERKIHKKFFLLRPLYSWDSFAFSLFVSLVENFVEKQSIVIA